jgi:NAD(P)H-hydrate epimerase
VLPGRPLHDAVSIRACDAAAIARGTPGTTLMAAAGAAAAAEVRRRWPAARRVVCVCGGGANGGDGLVVARLLRAEGRDASCLVLASRPYAGDAAWACDEAVAAGVPVSRVGAVGEALEGVDVVVDALLGTGARGAPQGAVAEAIAAIDAADAPVLSIDVPSGVDASSGEAAGAAVRADVTVTFHAEKIGLRVMPGSERAGEIVVADIGIPDDVEVEAPAVVADAAALAAIPPRARGGSKYDAGSLLLVGGSLGMTGAITLASTAALRAGAGIVVAAVPASLNPILEVKLTEAMTLPLADADGALAAAAADAVLERAARMSAVVVGPGLGRTPGAAALVRRLVAAIGAPLVLDADGLHALGDDLAPLAARQAPTVVTPHAGEAARLLGCAREEVDAHRLAAVLRLAASARAVAVLKGSDTIVATPGGEIAVRDGDDPWLATAGTGDVLAGTVGALLARGAPAATAACAAVVAHLAAAREARSAEPGRALVASDLVDRLRLAP